MLPLYILVHSEQHAIPSHAMAPVPLSAVIGNQNCQETGVHAQQLYGMLFSDDVCNRGLALMVLQFDVWVVRARQLLACRVQPRELRQRPCHCPQDLMTIARALVIKYRCYIRRHVRPRMKGVLENGNGFPRTRFVIKKYDTSANTTNAVMDARHVVALEFVNMIIIAGFVRVAAVPLYAIT